MKKLFASFLLFLSIAFIAGCNPSHGYVDIYTSIYPLEFLTKEIVGDHLIVRSIYPMGADVHDYEPSAKVIVNMAQSQGIFYIGSGLEAFIEAAENTTFKNMQDKLLELSNFVSMIEPGEEHESEAGEGGHSHTVDPHIWLDPLRMVTMAEAILDRVITILPEKEDEFRANAAEIIEKLEKLDEDYLEQINDPSIARKIILVDHDAYLYWEERYGIERMRARVDNSSCEVIPNVFIANLALIEEYGIQHIAVTAYEYQCAVTDQYIAQANLQKVTLHHLATITEDDMENNMDYIQLMYQNLSVLKRMFPKTS